MSECLEGSRRQQPRPGAGKQGPAEVSCFSAYLYERVLAAALVGMKAGQNGCELGHSTF